MYTLIRHVLFCLSLTVFSLSILASVFFLSKVREHNFYIRNLIYAAVWRKHLTQTDEIALSLDKEVYRRTNRALQKQDVDWYAQVESFSFFNVTPAVALRYGTYGFLGQHKEGPCGTMTRIVLNALWELGIPARKLQLDGKVAEQESLSWVESYQDAIRVYHRAKQFPNDGHTMVEFYHDGAWRVTSPADHAFAWHTDEGKIATADDIQNDPRIYAQIYQLWPDYPYSDYPYTFVGHSNINWEKLPREMRVAIKAVMGEQWFAAAQTPRLYDQPRTLLFLVSLGASSVSGVLAYVCYAPPP